jgi:hypothetical protein
MAGLGAWGGAGLTGSLASLGAEATAEAAGTAATEGYKEVAKQAITQGTDAGLREATKNAALEGVQLPSNYAEMYGAQTAAPQVAQQSLEKAITPELLKGLTPEQIQASKEAVPGLLESGAKPENIMQGLGRASAAQGTSTAANVGTGLKNVFTSADTAKTFLGDNVMTLGSAVVPALMQEPRTGAGPAGYQEDQYDKRLKGYRLGSDYQAYEAPRPNPYYQAQYASGGIARLAPGGGPVQQMSQNVMGGQGNMYPQSQQEHTNFATPTQMPASAEVIRADYDTKTDPYSGVMMAGGGIARYASRGQVNVLQNYLDAQQQQQQQMGALPEGVGVPRTGIYRDTDVDTAKKDALSATLVRLNKTRKAAGMKGLELPKTSIKGLGQPDVEEAAAGGTMRYNLGGYSDGGRMLKGPGDGMSDSIPASISGKQPARLADGEFVVPADVVSHLGNGSTDAGAKKLYGMMDKIRKARTGKKKQAPAVKADKYMPA